MRDRIEKSPSRRLRLLRPDDSPIRYVFLAIGPALVLIAQLLNDDHGTVRTSLIVGTALLIVVDLGVAARLWRMRSRRTGLADDEAVTAPRPDE